MHRLGVLLLAAALAGLFAASCEGEKAPPLPVAGLDAEALSPPDAEAPQIGLDAGPGLDAQDPGLSRKDGGVTYPAGPYGTAVGDTVQDIKLYGYPKGTTKDPKNTWSVVSLSQFYDPDGNKGPGGVALNYLFVDISARWCSFCKLEAAGDATNPSLNAKCAAHAAKGLACYTSLFQNETYGLAERTDINWWMTQYDISFAITVDPAFQWGTFFKQEATPLNMFVDLKTMKVKHVCTGADEPCIDKFLCSTYGCAAGEHCDDTTGKCVK